MEVLKYVKYCLGLFDECTVNDLGHFYFHEAPPEKDNNNNVVGSKHYLIGFSEDYVRKARLTGIIAGKEGCDGKKADALIHEFASQIHSKIEREGEAWINGIGLLKKNDDGSLVLRSHKFPIKTFAETITVPQKSKQENKPAEKFIPQPSSQELNAAVIASQATAPPPVNLTWQRETNTAMQEIAAVSEAIQEPKKQPVLLVSTAAIHEADKIEDKNHAIEKKPAYAQTIAMATQFHKTVWFNSSLLYVQKFAKSLISYPNNLKLGILAGIIFLHFYIKNTLIPSFRDSSASAQNTNESKLPAGNEPAAYSNYLPAQNSTTEKDMVAAFKTTSTAASIPGLLKQKDKIAAEKEQQKLNKKQTELTTANTSGSKEIVEPITDNTITPLIVQNSVNKIDAGEPEKRSVAVPAPVTTDLKLPAVPANAVTANSTTAYYANPEFPGGAERMAKFIRQNVQYPNAAREENISGSVKVSFTIDENGSIKNPVIVQGLGGGCDEEALRVISKMPKWKPASSDGTNVSSQKTIKIVFQLAKE